MSEIINNEVDIPVVEVEAPVVEKNKGGRPNTTGLKFDKTNSKVYHNEYYQTIRNQDVKCECGSWVQKACYTRHKKRPIHITRMKKLEEA